MTLTQRDIQDIEEVVDEKLGERLRILPTRDEFFNRMDEVMGELKAIRQEHTIIGQ